MVYSNIRRAKMLKKRTRKELSHQIENDDKFPHSALTNPITIYFHLAYFFCLSPFRFVKNTGKNGYYERKLWRPQQLLCVFLQVLCMIRLLSKVRVAIPEHDDRVLRNPTPYFKLVLACCRLFYKTVTIKRFWFNSQDYLNVLNVIVRSPHLPYRKIWTTKPSFLYMFYGIVTFVVVVTGSILIIPVSGRTPSLWLGELVKKSRFVFCFSFTHSSAKDPDLSTLTFWDGFLASITYLAQFERYAIGVFCDMCHFAFALTLWTTAQAFAMNIKEVLEASENDDEAECTYDRNTVIVNVTETNTFEYKTWSNIYKNFQAIQNLSRSINNAIGTQIFWYLAEALMDYSISLNDVLIANDSFQRLRSLAFICLSFWIFYLCTDIYKLMAAAKTWLTTNNNIQYVPSDQANLILHEIITKEIGVRGNNAFTITLAFAAGFLSLIVTFFVICVQYI